MRAKPLGRDYKHTRPQGIDWARYRDFLLGLGAGLLVALIVYVQQRATHRTPVDERGVATRPEPQRPAGSAAASVEDDVDSGQNFDFYSRLPTFEVVVPEQEGQVQQGMAGAPISRPGTYVLQAGSYRNLADAERVRAQLALQGVTAAVQRVAVDADVWHRVRIGPSSDLTEINRLRAKLRTADLDALVIRVGD